jgi:hypothetical protein
VLALTSDEAMWQIVENNCPYMTDFYVRHHPHLILGFVDLSGCTLSGQATKMLILCNHVSFNEGNNCLIFIGTNTCTIDGYDT